MKGFNGQLDSSNGGGGRPTVMTSTTYAELKQLRDSNGLTPGAWYRITDYTCTTTQDDTQSAGHVFDIIVRADDASHLNENAYAAHHAGDTYFQDCKLEAWELKYCIDNDNTRFAWADEDGKGVIFFMKDEWNNQCHYDFKNIMFKRYSVQDNSPHGELSDLDGRYLGWIGDINSVTIDNDDYVWCYTFCIEDNTNKDLSIRSMLVETDEDEFDFNYFKCLRHGVCSDNVIKTALGISQIDDKSARRVRILNNIVIAVSKDDQGFIQECVSNLFGEANYNMTLHGFPEYNIFGNSCQNNIVSGYANKFGAKCTNNTFGNYCYQNTFGNYCYQNTFGNGCNYNTFGNDCSDNTFGNDCDGNTFGNYCQYNTFGNYCYQNTFGNNCDGNTFGNGCGGNTFGDYCGYNTFGNYCQYNTFGNYCQYNTFGDYCKNITSFDGVYYCEVQGGTDSAPIQNAQILNGTAGTSIQNKLTISFAAGKKYTQVAGKNTSGALKIFNPADAA